MGPGAGQRRGGRGTPPVHDRSDAQSISCGPDIVGVDGRAIAWLSYFPIPGLALVPAFAAPQDRLARFHAWQGGALVILLYLVTALLGFLGRAVDAGWWRTMWGLIVGLVLVAALWGLIVGMVAAWMGRHVRLRPVWDLLRLMGK